MPRVEEAGGTSSVVRGPRGIEEGGGGGLLAPSVKSANKRQFNINHFYIKQQNE